MVDGPDTNDTLTDLVARCVLVFERDGQEAVDALLARHPAFAAEADRQLEALREAGLLVAQRTPTTIGPYRVLQRLGSGGMGTVWLCEQTTPIRRRLAVKVIRPGMDSSEVLARFQVERQALALLDHPHIAKVLDAGITEDRLPYLAMEYVAGQPITTYCNERAMHLRERLQLFARVCDAVQHAHHKGILHRDLKPGNVLVGDRDGSPFPVVIDFGVAKSVTGAMRGATLFTLPGRLLGTPEYMSPEQAAAQDVDTRSDVYGLGVLLYELLTGTLPIPSKQLERAPDLARMLLEHEPQTPSMRLTSLGETAQAIAADRRTDPASLRRALRGDLDWIVLKALEKDRNRRYGMPAELAADVRRHLADEPVEAARPSPFYRLRKYCVRHRLQAASAAVAVTALAVGFATSLAFYREAAAAGREARASASRLHDSLDTALSALDRIVGVGAEGLRRLPRSEQLRAQLAQSALELHERLLAAGQPEDPRQSAALASTLARAANLNLLLAQHGAAARLAQRASSVLLGVGTGATAPETAMQCAAAHHACGTLLHQLGDSVAAERHQREALRSFESLAPAHRTLPGVRGGLLHTLRELSDLANDRDAAAALRWLERAQPLATAELDDPSAPHECRYAALKCIARLGWLCIETGDAERSLELTRRARDRAFLLLHGTRDLPEQIDYIDVVNSTTNTELRLGEWESARSDAAIAAEVLRRAQRDFPDLVQYRKLLSRTLGLQAMLAGEDVAPSRVDAMEREALQLAEEHWRLLGSSPYYGEWLLNDLLSYAGNRIEWLQDERYRDAVDLPFVREVTARAQRLFEGLPAAFQNARTTREGWLRSHFIRARLHDIDGDPIAAARELEAGVASCNELLRAQPDVVQYHLIRAEQALELVGLRRRTGDELAAWRWLQVAVLDAQAAGSAVQRIPNGWRRTLPMMFQAADLVLGRRPPADVLAGDLTALAAAFAAAEPVAASAGYASASRLGEVAMQSLALARERGLPAARLDDPVFAPLRDRPGFPRAEPR